VARRMAPERLGLLMFDPDPLVRLVVAERLPEERLGALQKDEDLRVRFTVAERAPMALLPRCWMTRTSWCAPPHAQGFRQQSAATDLTWRSRTIDVRAALPDGRRSFDAIIAKTTPGSKSKL